VASPESADEQARKARRAPRPAGEAGDKPKSRTVKAKADAPEVAKTEGADGDAKAPAKRVRKAGTKDAAAS